MTADAALAAIWARRRDDVLASVEVVEGAVLDGVTGSLDSSRREAACREAHKLAGSLGTFGFLAAGEMAREIEHVLGASMPAPKQFQPLADLVVALRRDVEASPAERSLPDVPPEQPQDLLVVGGDSGRMRRIADEAVARGLEAIAVLSCAAAREAIRSRRPRLVLLDPDVPEGTDAALELLAELAADFPVLVLTDPGEVLDRVEVARHGGRGFLPRTNSVPELIEQVLGLRERLRATETKILAVDDDASVLGAIKGVLEVQGLTVHTCSHPDQLWEKLEELNPDLLMLDIDMPGVSGLELCRAVRNDLRWSSLPILILTARNEPDTAEAVFEAGADDYIAKPFGQRELSARITNRLERVRLFRALADSDALTGLANRRRATAAIETFRLLSKRTGQPLCLAVLDVDEFKQINSSLGHGGGDETLRLVARGLAQHFAARMWWRGGAATSS